MDTFFDLMNVSKDLRIDEPGKNHPAQKLPFGAALDEQKMMLLDTKDFISKMRVEGKTDLLPFQRGAILTCTAMPMLHDHLTKLFPQETLEIFTYRLNQDVLEQLFALVRAAGATYTHPSPVEFKYRIRKVLLGRNPEIVLNDKKTNVKKERTNEKFQILTLKVCIT